MPPRGRVVHTSELHLRGSDAPSAVSFSPSPSPMHSGTLEMGDDWLRQRSSVHTDAWPCCSIHAKLLQPISANKTARGILSPIQAQDLQFAYALA